jgi:hypothetical protein
MFARRVSLTTLLTALALGSGTPRTASAQMYLAYWSGNGETRFVRAASDSTVVTAEVRHSPVGSATSLGIVFMYYQLVCGSGPNHNFAFAVLGTGDSEVKALEGGLLAHFTPVSLSDDEPGTALVIQGCLAIGARHRTLRNQ